ncbi:HupE/UreJ family protein [uncultured Eudoraea sp.]|uniref:HupE/UreJ family protein n=1 Tax=uncultured Eudoraea sp. TaxID=1035614 RepID=UPI002615C4F3|nr:HupE/UreJ family protein [uncultured Eudoraea sp.]
MNWKSNFLLGLIFSCGLTVSTAHEGRPLFVEIMEKEAGIFELQYKIPLTIPQFNLPDIFLPDSFEAIDKITLYQTSGGFIKRQNFKSASALNSGDIRIQYPVMNPSVSCILKITLLNGQKFNKLLGPDELLWTVPEEESWAGVARQYTQLGIQHILEGWDHLLFLICLMLVAGVGKKLWITITGFTIAHSITLALSALNVVRLPIPPVEAVIALSVVYLAVEIALQKKDSLTYRYPITVSSSFGLLHGFGFAAVLAEIGLPQLEIVTSLLFFNVGVELGQIIFVVGILLLWILIRKIFIDKNLVAKLQFNRIKLERLAAYFCGSIASFWMIERLYGFII